MPARNITERFDLRTLMDRTGVATWQDLADLVGVPRNTVRGWDRRGMSYAVADRVAIAVGRHPGSVWPHWYPPQDRLSSIFTALEVELDGTRWAEMAQAG